MSCNDLIGHSHVTKSLSEKEIELLLLMSGVVSARRSGKTRMNQAIFEYRLETFRDDEGMLP